MGSESSLEEFHATFPSLQPYIPNIHVLNELKDWIAKLAPHLRSADYRHANNERIRIEMRRIVKEKTKIELPNDSLIDLIVDFLIRPYS